MKNVIKNNKGVADVIVVAFCVWAAIGVWGFMTEHDLGSTDD